MKFLLIALLSLFTTQPPTISCTEKVAKPTQIVMHWKNEVGNPILTFSQLFDYNPRLTWAMNGGMYTERYEPLGFYVENGKKYRSIKIVQSDYFNFGKKPQAVFLITKDNKAMIVDVYHPVLKGSNIKYATQSAPMLLINSQINPKLTKSSSKAVRNGVGILPNGDVLMAVSDSWCTFQEFARYFKDKGCTTAMFLDGGISKGLTRELKEFANFEYGPFIGVK